MPVLTVPGSLPEEKKSPESGGSCLPNGAKQIKNGGGRFIVDLAGLEYISSAGLRGILTIGKACKAAKAALAFCSMQAMVADMFKLSGFTSILTVYASLEEALAGMR